MSSTHYIHAKIHTTGNSHHGGYCSDPYDFYDIDEHTTRTFSVPNKDFIRNHCDSDGEITWSGMEVLSTHDQRCNGSGYCGCSIYRKVTRATLKKRRNIKAEFLGDESSDEEVTPPTKKVTPPTKKVTPPTKKVTPPTKKVTPPTKKVAPPSHVTAPMPIVNSFRGRINSTYTANPSWYNTSTKPYSKFDDPIYRASVSQIPCNRGKTCHRKNHTSKPCYYNHD
jgi:hypothetical protein